MEHLPFTIEPWQSSESVRLFLYGQRIGERTYLYVSSNRTAGFDLCLGEIVYAPGVVYRLTSRTQPGLIKVFQVLGYVVPDTVAELFQDEAPQIELRIRYFNPYTLTPHSGINRYKFPLCIAMPTAVLSPQQWNIESITLPAKFSNIDEVIPINVKVIKTVNTKKLDNVPALPQSQPEKSIDTPASIVHEVLKPRTLDLRHANFKPSRKTGASEISGVLPAARSHSHYSQPISFKQETPSRTDSPEGNQIVVQRSDVARVHQMLERWVELSKGADRKRSWWLSRSRPSAQTETGMVVRNADNKIVFEYSPVTQLLRTPQSPQVLRAWCQQIAADAALRLAKKQPQLSTDAKALLNRLQTVPTQSTAQFLQHLFDLTN